MILRGLAPTPRRVLFLSVVLLAAVALVFWDRRRAPRPFPELERMEADDEATIFVSIASYRDDDCSGTLRSMYEKAAAPRRIFVGICQQNKPGEATEECVPPDFPWRQNIRTISMSHTDAKGPTFARYRCSTLYAGETYFCQIDSHMVFLKDWDRDVIRDLHRCPSAKPVLSFYPHDTTTNDTQKNASTVPVLCKSKFNDNNIVTFEAVSLPAAETPRPIPFTAGGFLFGPGSIPREVPFDPTLDHLFNGEEILYSARLWTSGYDMYAPLRNYVFHYYVRKEKPKYWNDIKTYASAQKASQDRAVRLLGLDGKPPMTGYTYGLGAARTLASYLAFAGLDPARKTSDSQNKFCKS